MPPVLVDPEKNTLVELVQVFQLPACPSTTSTDPKPGTESIKEAKGQLYNCVLEPGSVSNRFNGYFVVSPVPLTPRLRFAYFSSICI